MAVIDLSTVGTPKDRRRWARRTTRPCPACGNDYSCEWSLDAWVCRLVSCGSEWYVDHDALIYADPSDLDVQVARDAEAVSA